MNKMIPIGLFSTLLLTACGGDSGGGNSGPAPAPKYTWQFVQMKSDTYVNMMKHCDVKPTEFNIKKIDLENPDSWIYTFAVQAPSISDILVYDKDGVLYDTNLSKFSIDPKTASLTFSENNIPPGGYITVVDSIDGGSKHILTVQRELLSDALIKINAEQGRTACYSKNKLVESDSNKKVTIGAENNDVKSTSVDGFLIGQSQKGSSSTKTEIETLKNEYVLLSGFDLNDQIVAFTYQPSTALSNMNDKTIAHELEDLSDSLNITLQSAPRLIFSDMTVFSSYKGQIFTWNSWNAELPDFTAHAKLGNGFGYAATFNGRLDSWSVMANAVVDPVGNASVELNSLDMQGIPVLECGNVGCYLNIEASTGLSVGVTKIEYTANVTNHTIYSTNREINIPEIPRNINTTYPDNTTPINVSFLMGDNITDKARSGFMSYSNIKENPPRDGYIDMLIAPGLEMKHQLGVKQSNFISVVSP